MHLSAARGTLVAPPSFKFAKSNSLPGFDEHGIRVASTEFYALHPINQLVRIRGVRTSFTDRGHCKGVIPSLDVAPPARIQPRSEPFDTCERRQFVVSACWMRSLRDDFIFFRLDLVSCFISAENRSEPARTRCIKVRVHYAQLRSTSETMHTHTRSHT